MSDPIPEQSSENQYEEDMEEYEAHFNGEKSQKELFDEALEQCLKACKLAQESSEMVLNLYKKIFSKVEHN